MSKDETICRYRYHNHPSTTY